MFGLGGGVAPSAEDFSRVKAILQALSSPEAQKAAHAELEAHVKKASETHVAATAAKAQLEKDKQTAEELIKVKFAECDAAIAASWKKHHADVAARNLDAREAGLVKAEQEMEQRRAAISEQERKIAAKLAKLNAAIGSIGAAA
jgi:hypothetical protein